MTNLYPINPSQFSRFLVKRGIIFREVETTKKQRTFFHFGVKEIYKENVCKEMELAVPLKNYLTLSLPKLTKYKFFLTISTNFKINWVMRKKKDVK